MNVLASSTAPPAVAALTDFVFRDPAALGQSMAIVSVSALVIALACLRSALGPVREAVEQQERSEARP